MIGHSKTGRYAKCRAPKRCWVSSVSAAGAACRCNELYRQLFNPQLYLLAYGRIYSNQGAMTPGVTRETVDGMSLGKIGRIIDAMRHERYRFSPVTAGLHPEEEREDYARSACRPGRTNWSAKWSACCWRRTTSRQFSDRSHGFRPGRGCHTALREVADTWTGTTWFIEGDISDCFGSLDHEIMLDDPGGEDPRQPVPAAGAQHAASRIPGGLGMECHAQRRAAGWGGFTRSSPTSTCTGWTPSSRQF